MMDDVADNMLMTEQANEILGQPLNDVGVAEELERAFSELMVGESESDLLNDKGMEGCYYNAMTYVT